MILRLPSLLALASTLTSTLLLPLAQAAETDNFTGRTKELASLSESMPVLDVFVNERIQNAIEKVNASGSCDSALLYENVWNRLSHNPISKTETFVETSPLIQSYLVPFKDGIYSDVPTFIEEKRSPRVADLFILSGWFAGSIRLNRQIIGIDKLGHFFGQGWEYFQTGSLKDALDLGIQDEEGMDGYIGSGVYSYGDLSANAAGLKFWQNLLGGADPYIRCESGAFIQKRRFSWQEYVTSAWDEALNCSKYVSPAMTAAVQRKLDKLQLSCPVDPSACRGMIDASPCSALTVNPVCFEITGISLEEKNHECDLLKKKSLWGEVAQESVAAWDRMMIKADTYLGIAGLPFHFIWRDLFKQSIRSI